ncbi:hypothetical protein JTE90_022090 [Oedothorax gibbosus]|uniref:CRAL-TRIO domain-containing protein n=1 Tax=Oedothorax gibbosus TaxID=931172 RepID=A0AAV6TZK3_9ARAC|nr:hypothetical protein JTE90_022090 [Oedothorax gibbosus]
MCWFDFHLFLKFRLKYSDYTPKRLNIFDAVVKRSFYLSIGLIYDDNFLLRMTDPIYYNLSKYQNEALEKMRNKMSEELRDFESYNNSFVLYRFLKARQWDANKAEIMFKKCIQWRRQNNLKEYQQPEILQKYFHNMCIGNDKEGCPIIYIPLGKVDANGFINSTKTSDVIKTLAQFIIKHELILEEKCFEIKRWLSGGLLIFDFEGLDFATATNRKGIELMVRIIRFGQDMFPERLKAVFLIKAPSLFSIPYRIVKNFLAPETQEKIQFFSTEGWQEKLLELIDTDVLPAFMGGTRTDPDGNPYCDANGNNRRNYYLAQNGDNSLAHVPGVNTLLVPRSSTKRILLRAENVGCVIEWEFEVKAGDIGFGLFLEKTPDERTPVVVLDRVDAKDCVVTGVYNCEKRGNYYAEFDNSYSWIKAKEILYIFKIYSNESWKRN